MERSIDYCRYNMSPELLRARKRYLELNGSTSQFSDVPWEFNPATRQQRQKLRQKLRQKRDMARLRLKYLVKID